MDVLFREKRIIFIYIAAMLFLYTTPAPAAEALRISAASAILMDAGTGQVIYDHHGFKRREPASLTKIMTAIIALEYGHPEEIVLIGREPAGISVGQELRLNRGDRLSLENLIKAALLYSANDSTVAIAQHVAGNEERFIDLMNTKALILGALDTRFANTNGYHHPNHYTTAHDLAVITRYALANSDFAGIVRLPRATIYWADGKKEKPVENTNSLVRENSYEGIMGVKTGTTIRAGNCLVAAAGRNGRTLIAVILHSRDRYRDAVELLNYGFSQGLVKICARGEIIDRMPVTGGLKDQVEAVCEKDINLYLADEDLKVVTRKVIAQKPLAAPVKAGQEVGTVVFVLRGRELARAGLAAAGQVDRPGLLHRLKSGFNTSNCFTLMDKSP
ncbi:MAG: D-alanyl-D-alanine carboxypeptidase [Actinobacteria bacterium]|nr:D-alanyl-D-alanine carboxypeptidase [Actinomycetota bacterium]